MSTVDRRALIAEAGLAPSVHNVQPARWRLVGDDGLALFEDLRCRLTVGDPRGNDAGISLGAAAEGMRLAAGRQGLSLSPTVAPADEADLRGIAGWRLIAGGESEPLAEAVAARRSWRGAFAAAVPADRVAAGALASADAAVVSDAAMLRQVAGRYDAASYAFMRDDAFRRELRSWLRLDRRHPRYAIDGLNAAAMAMGRVEARGAGLVLGPGFRLLARIGLARPLLAEGAKVAGAAALVVFHRPRGEPPFESGAAFYRLWLRIEAAGFGAAVLAALADDAEAAAEIARIAGLRDDRRIVSAFRIGRRPPGAAPARARRAIDDLLV
jgi:nitroreductase